MPFKKGKSGNPKGKPKGSENKTTSEARQLFTSFMEGEVDKVKESFEKVRAKDHAKYLELLSKYFPYFIPKKSESDHNLKFPEDKKFTLNVK
jgi:hypothetical protein